MPKLLWNEQQHLWFDMMQDVLESINIDPDFVNTMTPGDGSWIHGHNSQTNAHSLLR